MASALEKHYLLRTSWKVLCYGIFLIIYLIDNWCYQDLNFICNQNKAESHGMRRVLLEGFSSPPHRPQVRFMGWHWEATWCVPGHVVGLGRYKEGCGRRWGALLGLLSTNSLCGQYLLGRPPRWGSCQDSAGPRGCTLLHLRLSHRTSKGEEACE